MPTTPGLPPEAEPQHRCADCGALRPESQMTYLVSPTKGQVWYCANAWWRGLRNATPREKIEAITGERLPIEPDPTPEKRDPLAAVEPSPRDEPPTDSDAYLRWQSAEFERKRHNRRLASLTRPRR